VVLDRVAELSRLYGGAPVVSDAHLPGVVKEELRARGVERVEINAWNANTLTRAFRSIRGLALADSIPFPDDGELLGELLRVQTRMRSGQPTVELPRSTQSPAPSKRALCAVEGLKVAPLPVDKDEEPPIPPQDPRSPICLGCGASPSSGVQRTRH
jgi:hypothetical protein